MWRSTLDIPDHIPPGDRTAPRRDDEWRRHAHAEWRAFVERALGV
jgi:hypothetical protein